VSSEHSWAGNELNTPGNIAKTTAITNRGTRPYRGKLMRALV
jgi:hypothetical protein